MKKVLYKYGIIIIFSGFVNIMILYLQRPRPHSTLGIERQLNYESNSSSSEDMNKEPAWIKGPDWTRHSSQTSEESEL